MPVFNSSYCYIKWQGVLLLLLDGMLLHFKCPSPSTGEVNVPTICQYPFIYMVQYDSEVKLMNVTFIAIHNNQNNIIYVLCFLNSLIGKQQSYAGAARRHRETKDP